MEKKKWIEKITTKTLTKRIMDFEYLDLDLIFKGSNLGHFLLD
jgi:hypothetical protein